MEKLEFDEWWKDFQSYHKNDKDGGMEALSHLKSVVGGFVPEKRIMLIDEFIQNKKLGIAAELIELYGNEAQKELIREKLRLCILSNQFDSISFTYLKSVLRTYQPKDHNLLKLYFKKQTIFNRIIPTELFKIDQKLFLYAFKKMFKNYPEADIYNYDGLLYLVDHLDILEFLIDNLSFTQAKRLKMFCKVKSTHSIVNDHKWKEELIKLSEKKLRLLTNR